MREILFRGFCCYEEGNETIVLNGEEIKGFWIEGSLVKTTYNENGKNKIYTIQDMEFGFDEEGMPVYQRGVAEEVIPETVGQYTGLTDINGVKMFEGDIVEITSVYNKGKRYIVYYSEDRRGWFPFARGDGCGCCEHEVEDEGYCEVIGNIHEDPELLNE